MRRLRVRRDSNAPRQSKERRNEDILRQRKRGLTYAEIGVGVGLGERQVQRIVKSQEAEELELLRSLARSEPEQGPAGISHEKALRHLDDLAKRKSDLFRLVRKYDPNRISEGMTIGVAERRFDRAIANLKRALERLPDAPKDGRG